MTDPESGRGAQGPPESCADGAPIALTAALEDAGLRLDAFLTGRCPEFSRSRIHQDIKAGRVTVNGRPRLKSHRLEAGDAVLFTPGIKPALTAASEDLPLEVVYRDDHLLVIDKKAGMVVHPAVGHPGGTVVNALLHLLGGAPAGGNPLRPGIVHRLDRDTSGLMAVALTEQAHNHLSAQLQDRRMGRTYLALSWGRWDSPEGVLTGDIGRNPRFRQQMAIVQRGGRPAITHFQVVEDFGFVQYCRIRLETGRTHQIRVHFAHHRHPVVGDRVYGDDRRVRGLHGGDRPVAERLVKVAGRQMLHAAGLRLEHPADGRVLEFESPLPADMALALKVLRGADPA